jgi:hypothetical protein
MATEHQPPAMSAGSTGQRAAIGPAASSALLRLAVDYNDALDRCTQTGGANIDALMDLFAEDATWVIVGVTSVVGKAAIRDIFLGRTARYQQVVELKGVDIWGDLVICRGERRDTTFVQVEGEKQVRILLVKEGKIRQVTVVHDPEAYAQSRGGAAAATRELDALSAGEVREEGGRPGLD